MSDMIRLESVRKTFREHVAVEGMDLRIGAGELCGFIGPNGAGKTTTLRLILGILFPDSGVIEVLGRANAIESRDRLGYLPEERGVYRKMKVGAFLRYMGRLKGVPERVLDDRIASWLRRVELPDVVEKRCEELSKGMQQKVQFIAAVLPEPELLILDEPFSGLDPVNMRLLRSLIDEQHREGRTVIFSTHVMAHAEEVCDRVVMIHRGRKMLDDTLTGIRAAHRSNAVVFEPAAGHAEHGSLGGLLSGLPGVASVEAEGPGYRIGVEPHVDPGEVLRSVVAAVPTSRIGLHRPSLEDIFIAIVRGTDGQDEQEEDRLRRSLRAETATVAGGEGA